MFLDFDDRGAQFTENLSGERGGHAMAQFDHHQPFEWAAGKRVLGGFARMLHGFVSVRCTLGEGLKRF
ncbi:hypothetical protein D3C85_1686140 [compost metagenome]